MILATFRTLSSVCGALLDKGIDPHTYKPNKGDLDAIRASLAQHLLRYFLSEPKKIVKKRRVIEVKMLLYRHAMFVEQDTGLAH